MSKLSYNYDVDYFDEETEVNYFSSIGWPISGTLLVKAIENGMTLGALANKYRVPFAEVIELCEEYGLEYDYS